MGKWNSIEIPNIWKKMEKEKNVPNHQPDITVVYSIKVYPLSSGRPLSQARRDGSIVGDDVPLPARNVPT